MNRTLKLINMSFTTRTLVIIVLASFFIACDVTKRVPEGSYLLNNVEIDIKDSKDIKENNLKPYLRQKPNTSIPVLGKAKLKLYNIPKNDSIWINRRLRKWGEPPVLYSDRLTSISAEQIRMQMNNKGYLNAEVDTNVVLMDKKADVNYLVIANIPHKIQSFTDTIHSVDTTIYNILKKENKLNIVEVGKNFDLEILDIARNEMINTLKNNGYYNFSKDNFYFLADTTSGDYEVKLILGLYNPNDTSLHKQYFIGNVNVFNGIDKTMAEEGSLGRLDTVNFRGINVISKKDIYMHPQAIYYNTYLKPNRLYTDRILERTYASLNALGSVKQSNIELTPVERNDSNYLDANISLMPGNLHYLQFGLDGTNSAGDLGLAANITYEHRNIFRRGERLRFRLNGAYEYMTAADSRNLLDQSYYEYGGEVFLSVPQLLLPWQLKRLQNQNSSITDFSIGLNYQKRPEYLRQFFSLSSRFQWSSNDWNLSHVLNPMNITYVRMPWVSDLFKTQYLNDSTNYILKYSYENQFIAFSSYSVSFSNIGFRHIPTLPFRMRAGIEVAGWLPRLVSPLFGNKTNENNQKVIVKIPYAEYVKGDLDFAPHYVIDENKTIAGHIALGVAYPYGNSVVLPFEKRYFGGGANSVRGWSTRTLGPGSYSVDTLGYDFVNKTGDIKIDLSLEYRRKITPMFELAGFIDAGNIWTIKDYDRQSGGYFEFNDFYKELAVSYGLGLRMDLKFLLLRLDTGMKAHNPARPLGNRWTIFDPNFKRDFAFHFAIGYPF